jgi:hypothetical protein
MAVVERRTIMSEAPHEHDGSDDGTHQAALISADNGSLEFGGDHLLAFLDPIESPLFAAEDSGNDAWLPTVVPVGAIDPPISIPDLFLHDTSHFLFT